MEELKNIRLELGRLDDMVDTIEKKIYDIVGLLELVYLGITELHHEEDSYELSSISVLKNYLSAVNKTDITMLHETLAILKENVTQ